MAQERRISDDHKRCSKVRNCEDARPMTKNNWPSSSISNRTTLTKSKNTKIRGSFAGNKLSSADRTVSLGNRQATTSNTGRSGSSRQRAGSAEPSKEKARDSSSESEGSEDGSWAASDGKGGVVMNKEPRNTQKTRKSMTEETVCLVTKILEIKRELIAYHKSDRGAEGTLTLND